MTPQPNKRHVGFRAMAPQRHKHTAAQGGAMAHKLRRAHRWTTEEARHAGKNGGKARWKAVPPVERSRMMRQAVIARWKRHTSRMPSTP